jgi:hypothetical protein
VNAQWDSLMKQAGTGSHLYVYLAVVALIVYVAVSRDRKSRGR